MKMPALKPNHPRAGAWARASQRAFTIIEGVVVLALMVMLIAATLSGILGTQISSSRVAEYNAALAIIEAKMEDIRAVYYSPPNYPYTTNSVLYITNTDAISLDKAGTSFLIQGTVISKIEYKGSLGHLVTVTATFQNPRTNMTLTLQTFVNKYCGGYQ
jgi:type II secretory pathway pseudopilin PulG